MQKIHFVAIGGAVMHNLAIALKKKGFEISGSDDEIFEPSKSRLAAYDLLPDKIGWDTNNITPSLDAIILGMHAREDNPEIIRAKELNIKMYSFPEFMYEITKNKIRVVISGSHGKTTITSMIMHVLKQCRKEFDYLVGSQIDGFETMVGFSENNNYAVFEGDEYLSSILDKRPKFHLYKPKIALLSGISWDHMNVFPTFENYLSQFKIFIEQIPEDGTLIYCANDEAVMQLIKNSNSRCKKIPYYTHNYISKHGETFLVYNKQEIKVPVFGKHNMQNLSGALEVCKSIGIETTDFYSKIQTFTGAARRLQNIINSDNTKIWLDFAHSPSKVKATCNAVKELHPQKKLLAIYELHTFSSLNQQFLPEYKNTLEKADKAIIYVDRKTLQHKNLPEFTEIFLHNCFKHSNLKIINDLEDVYTEIKSGKDNTMNVLLMSSGNFSGLKVEKVKQIVL